MHVDCNYDETTYMQSAGMQYYITLTSKQACIHHANAYERPYYIHFLLHICQWTHSLHFKLYAYTYELVL